MSQDKPLFKLEKDFDEVELPMQKLSQAMAALTMELPSSASLLLLMDQALKPYSTALKSMVKPAKDCNGMRMTS